MPSHKTFIVKKKLAKKMRPNRPHIPYWIRTTPSAATGAEPSLDFEAFPSIFVTEFLSSHVFRFQNQFVSDSLYYVNGPFTQSSNFDDYSHKNTMHSEREKE
ncbi:hypothetical protein K1719_010367 [Acacia pycnantha]|nr:hypothetical protein K1719_010367 [Acacia pycnantha]